MTRLLYAAPLYAIVLSIAALSGCKRDADGAAPAAKTAPVAQAATAPVAETATESAEQPATEPATELADAVGDTPTLRIALLDGETYDLASRRGQWVVLNFWATWCKPCLKEMPDLDAYDAARTDLEVVGLAYEEIEPQDMRAFLERRPVKYPIAIVDVYDPPAAFGTPRGLPMTYLVAPDGRIAQRFLGPVTSAELDAAISKHSGKTDAEGKKTNAPNPGVKSG